MRIDKAGLDLIKRFEGFNPDPYLCPARVPTIGYGTTHYIDGRKVTMGDHSISKETATYLLEEQVNHLYGQAVNAYVQVPITQNQFDALVSFAYNEGANALRTSTLLKKINNGSGKDAIIHEFEKWNKANHHVLKGLTTRRMAEDKLYFA